MLVKDLKARRMAKQAKLELSTTVRINEKNSNTVIGVNA